MGQKETIVNLLNTYGTMTQRALAEAIYGDKNHRPNIICCVDGACEQWCCSENWE